MTPLDVLADWSRRLEARTGYRLFYRPEAPKNRRLGITNGRRFICASDALWMRNGQPSGPHLRAVAAFLTRRMAQKRVGSTTLK